MTAVAEVAREPPKKKSLLVRTLEAVTPKRMHRFYTPEFIVGWNVSNYITWGQAYLVFQWEKVSLFWTLKVLPTATHWGKIFKDAATEVADLIHLS